MNKIICETCSNRKFDRRKGLCCGLTGERPDVSEQCESYEENESLSRRKKLETKCEMELDAMDGVVWFKAFAILWGGEFLVRLFFGGMIASVYQSMLPLLIFFLVDAALYSGFFSYTWWLTARKGYKLCYNIGALVIFLFAIHHCVSLFCIPFDDFYFFLSLFWLVVDCIALLFGLKLYRINFADKGHVSFDNKYLKYSYLALSVLVVSSLVFSTVSLFLE